MAALLSFSLLYIEIVIANVGEVGSIGRELGIISTAGAGRCHLQAGLGRQIEEPQLPVGIEEQVFRVGYPDVAGLLCSGCDC